MFNLILITVILLVSVIGHLLWTEGLGQGLVGDELLSFMDHLLPFVGTQLYFLDCVYGAEDAQPYFELNFFAADLSERLTQQVQPET